MSENELLINGLFLFETPKQISDFTFLSGDNIEFKKDEQDTRIKHVYLSNKGKEIFNEIFAIQKKRIYNALLSSKSDEVLNFDSVLRKIINE